MTYASASVWLEDVPLFPLGTVLFPRGLLDLRVFEPRYLDLVRECTRQNRRFGVCLILDGHESSQSAAPAAVGTLAAITDFYTDQDGLLGIRAEGSERFRVAQVHVRDDGQLRGDINCFDPEPESNVPAEHGILVTILERLVDQMAPPWKDVPHSRYDEASWTGFRLAELLPLDDRERQQLLEMTDPLERLAWLRDALARFQRN